ncbi:hypothetical protein TIFTF001_035928 [Ficus carica]|uniref:Uncharacterized protein n=2 Tax=Ficus carica TaxID=3494 RepID=A0AA88E2S1_FICCA|nr:hypothetical protein TIFTF001_035928 [Ficus carica]
MFTNIKPPVVLAERKLTSYVYAVGDDPAWEVGALHSRIGRLRPEKGFEGDETVKPNSRTVPVLSKREVLNVFSGSFTLTPPPSVEFESPTPTEICGTEDKADFGGEESGAAEAKFGGADAIGF